MIKSLSVLFLLVFFLFGCSKGKIEEVTSPPTEEEIVIAMYREAVVALDSGDAYYAGKKFKEVESLLPQTKWAAKASLMESYSHYSRNAYQKSIFSLERHIKSYPSDENIPYAHYLIAICYYEQILDEKKDLKPLLIAKKKFEYILSNFPDTDYATDAFFKLNLIIDQLAAKEMSIARFYIKTQKWIPAINRLKLVVEKYDRTVFIEEALHRLVEVYYTLGLIEEAQKTAAVLGYNYRSSEWYERTYKVFNKKYKTRTIEKKKELGFLRRKIKNLFD